MLICKMCLLGEQSTDFLGRRKGGGGEFEIGTLATQIHSIKAIFHLQFEKLIGAFLHRKYFSNKMTTFLIRP